MKGVCCCGSIVVAPRTLRQRGCRAEMMCGSAHRRRPGVAKTRGHVTGTHTNLASTSSSCRVSPLTFLFACLMATKSASTACDISHQQAQATQVSGDPIKAVKKVPCASGRRMNIARQLRRGDGASTTTPGSYRAHLIADGELRPPQGAYIGANGRDDFIWQHRLLTWLHRHQRDIDINLRYSEV